MNTETNPSIALLLQLSLMGMKGGYWGGDTKAQTHVSLVTDGESYSK